MQFLLFVNFKPKDFFTFCRKESYKSCLISHGDEALYIVTKLWQFSNLCKNSDIIINNFTDKSKNIYNNNRTKKTLMRAILSTIRKYHFMVKVLPFFNARIAVLSVEIYQSFQLLNEIDIFILDLVFVCLLAWD